MGECKQVNAETCEEITVMKLTEFAQYLRQIKEKLYLTIRQINPYDQTCRVKEDERIKEYYEK